MQEVRKEMVYPLQMVDYDSWQVISENHKVSDYVAVSDTWNCAINSIYIKVFAFWLKDCELSLVTK